jgi:hypothetical protein
MSNFQKTYNLPDFISTQINGQTLVVLITLYTGELGRQIRFQIVETSGQATNKMRWNDKVVIFQNILKESHPNEWDNFHKG